MLQRVRLQQEQIFPVLPSDRHIAVADLAREQGDALVARRGPGDRAQMKFAPVMRPQQLGLDLAPRIGGIGAQPFGAAIIMGELHQPQVLQPIALRISDGKDHGAGQGAVAVAQHGDRAFGNFFFARCRIGGGGERRFGRELQLAIVGGDALPKSDGTDMPLAHRAQRHDEPDGPFGHASLVKMRHHAGVHDGGGGIAVFVAEIGTDQLPLGITDIAHRRFHLRVDLLEAGHEHAARLPMARLEILQYGGQLLLRLALVHLQHFGHQPFGSAHRQALGLPGEVEGTHHHARRIGIEAQRMIMGVQHGPRLETTRRNLNDYYATCAFSGWLETDGRRAMAQLDSCSARIDSAP